MAAEGLRLARINLITSTFVFELDEPRETMYRIGYDRIESEELSQALVSDGWYTVFSDRNWYVAANDRPAGEVKTFPVHDGLHSRNRMKMLVLGGISVYCIFSTLLTVLITVLVVSRGGSVTAVPSPYWAITAVFWAFIIAIIYYWIR